MDGQGRPTVLGNDCSMTRRFLPRSSLCFYNAAYLNFVLFFWLFLILSSARAAGAQATPKSDPASIQKLELKYEKAVVGAKVRVAAEGLPAGETVELKWSTVTGGWVIQDYYY